jgi:hypothetical protein
MSMQEALARIPEKPDDWRYVDEDTTFWSLPAHVQRRLSAAERARIDEDALVWDLAPAQQARLRLSPDGSRVGD